LELIFPEVGPGLENQGAVVASVMRRGVWDTLPLQLAYIYISDRELIYEVQTFKNVIQNVIHKTRWNLNLSIMNLYSN